MNENLAINFGAIRGITKKLHYIGNILVCCKIVVFAYHTKHPVRQQQQKTRSDIDIVTLSPKIRRPTGKVFVLLLKQLLEHTPMFI